MSEDMLGLILADEETRISNCMLADGLNHECYQIQKDRDVASYRGDYSWIAGYFHLRNAFETEGLKGDNTDRRLKEIFTTATGGHQQGYDPNIGIEGNLSSKQRFDAAFAGSYAKIYLNLIDDGQQVYDDLQATAWHVFGGMVQKHRDETVALKETLNILFGDTVFERNGGVDLPNGIGAWHDREEMNKRGITLDMIEANKVNTFYHIYNKHGADLMFEPFLDRDKNWDVVAEGMLTGGGNVWWTVINDVETDGYRVVMVGQTGEGRYTDQGGYSQRGGIKILGDAYYDDGTGAKPIRLTKDEFFNSIGEAAAAEHAYSQLDWWDNMHLWFNKTKAEYPPLYPPRPMSTIAAAFVNATLALEEAGALTPGPDMSRKRIKYYMDKLGPGTDHYKNTSKAWTPYDTGFGTDLSNPGRLEIDMFYKPLWDDIQTFEAQKRRSGKEDEEVTDQEIFHLARQRYRGMFKGRGTYGLKRAFSMYDRFHIQKGPRFPSQIQPQDMTMEQLRGSVNPTGIQE